jgi:hypothetical protein
MTGTGRSPDADRLYELLPVYHRRRDAEAGGPLRALLAVIAEQVELVQADVEQLYENWFIETCQDWVVPYLGDLVGYRLPAGYTEALAGGDAARELAARLAPRRDVADTVANRRRKGTLPLLEELAMSVAEWPATALASTCSDRRSTSSRTRSRRQGSQRDAGRAGTRRRRSACSSGG